VEQERAFLQPFVARAAQGEVATAMEIHRTFEEPVGHAVDDSTIYRLLKRQGWKKPGTGLKASAGPASVADIPPVQEHPVPRRKRSTQDTSPQAEKQQRWPRYPSDLTDQAWAILEPLIPQAKPGGHPRTVDMREVLNAVLYVLCTGCQWRALPRDFPAWSTVWSYFRRWRINGVWEQMHTALREQLRVSMGREATPSAAIIDSQSVKKTEQGAARLRWGEKGERAQATSAG
jgi:transposase